MNQEAFESQVSEVLDKQINPALAGHGGFVKLVKIEGNNVHLEMGGGCQGCAGARATMKYGIETALKEQIAEMGEVVDATEHAQGASPFM